MHPPRLHLLAAANGEYKAVSCHREASTGCSPGGDANLEARSKEEVGRTSRLGQQAHTTDWEEARSRKVPLEKNKTAGSARSEAAFVFALAA